MIARRWPDAAQVTTGVFAIDPVDRRRVEVLDRDPAASAGRPAAAGDRRRAALRSEGHDVPRSGDARRRRRAGGRSAHVRVRRRRRRPVRQRVSAVAAAARGPTAIASSTRRSRRAPCSAPASARRSPACGRSAKCSSTTSSRPDSISSSTTPRRSAIAGAAACRWSCACRGAACATPGPYHSQNTEPWFYRTPGLKIVVPSTPHDARALMAAAVADPDPVLYYEHIALYRDPRIKQAIGDAAPRAASGRPRRAAPGRRRPRDHFVRRLRARRHARRRAAGRRRHRGERARPALARAARSRRRPDARAPHGPRADRARRLAHRRHRRIARRDHPGRGVRVARRARPHRRRARHAGAVLAAARAGVSAERGRDRARGEDDWRSTE